MTFSACLLEPLMEDPEYPFAFEIADNYVGLTALLGPTEKGEEAEVQLRTKLLCAKIILKTVVEPLLVEADWEEDAAGQGAQAPPVTVTVTVTVTVAVKVAVTVTVAVTVRVAVTATVAVRVPASLRMSCPRGCPGPWLRERPPPVSRGTHGAPE